MCDSGDDGGNDSGDDSFNDSWLEKSETRLVLLGCISRNLIQVTT